nr:cupin domain-containing protein [Desulfatitalea alkaliphila]
MRDLTINPETVRSGEPKVRGVVFSTTSGGRAVGGVWSCEGPAEIDFTFGADERLYVLGGSVDVFYLGARFTLRQGDTALFRAGTTATWNIADRLEKVWVVHDPGRVARAMSFLAGRE